MNTKDFKNKLIDYVSDAIISLDMDYNIVSWNKAAEVLYGWSAEEVIGKSSYDVIPVKFPYDTLEDVLKKFSEKGFWKGEGIQYHKNGSQLNILSSSVIINDEKSNSQIIVTINKDITERNRTQQKLKESEERFRRIIENAPVGYYRVGKDGLWQYVNPIWEKMHNYSLQEIVGKSFEITQPENAKEEARMLVQQVLSGESLTGEFGRTTKDGTEEYHTFNIQPIYKDGEIIAIEGFINDITELKNTEQKLRASEIKLRKLNNELEQIIEERTKELKNSEEKYHGIVKNISDIIYELDISGKYLYISHQLFNISGFSQEEMVGQNIFKYVHPDDLKTIAEKVREAFKTDEKGYLEFRL